MDFLRARAVADEGDLRSGDAFCAGEGLDNVIGKLVGGLADVAGVGFLKDDAAAVVGDGARERSSGGVGGNGEGGPFRQANAEEAGKVEVIGNDAACDGGIGTGEGFEGDVDGIAFFNRDGGLLGGKGEGGEDCEEQAGGERAESRRHGGFFAKGGWFDKSGSVFAPQGK